MVSVWYPAVPQAGLMPSPLLEPQIAQQPFFSDQFVAIGFPTTSFTDRLPPLVGYAWAGVPCATASAPYPILLCSPQGYGWRSSLAEKAANFASQGYIVVVSDPADCVASVFPDGQCQMLPHASYAENSVMFQSRWQDLTFILNELTRWNTEDAMFANRLDLANVAVMGTCCGAPPAAEFCRNDPRCRAAILISCDPRDNWPCGFTVPDVDQSGLGKPSLFVTGDADTTDNPSYLWLYNKRATDACAFRILGTAADSPRWHLQSMILVNDFHSLLFPNSLPLGREASRAITDYALWFLNKYLKGSSDPVPPSTNYPRIYGFMQK
jgi:hypothetical protein